MVKIILVVTIIIVILTMIAIMNAMVIIIHKLQKIALDFVYNI